MLDEKTKFYLRHWAALSEWAELRDGAVAEIATAVQKAVATLDQTVTADADPAWVFPPTVKDKPTFELSRAGWQHDGYHAAVAVQWKPQDLLTHVNPWPYVGVRVTGPRRASSPFVKELTKQLESHAAKLDWSGSQIERGWLWWRQVPPTGANDDLDTLTVACRAELERGWRELSGPIDRLFAVACR